MRDTGRSLCYGIERRYDHLARELSWDGVVRLAQQVSADPVVRAIYPELTRRPLKLRPTGPGSKGGEYDPGAHRVRVALDSQTDLVVLHELAHACLGGTSEKAHGIPWRNAFLFLLGRYGDPTVFTLVHGLYVHAGLLGK